jgi:hypothetical protein
VFCGGGGGAGGLGMHVVGLGHSRQEWEPSPAATEPRAWSQAAWAPPRCSECLPPAAAAHQDLTKTAARVGTPRQWLARAPLRPLRQLRRTRGSAGRNHKQTPRSSCLETQLLFPLMDDGGSPFLVSIGFCIPRLRWQPHSLIQVWVLCSAV